MLDRLFPMEHFSKLFTVALTAAGVSLLDANAIGKVVASKNNYRTHNSSEFFAISLMNLVGPLFSATTTSGNFSRTAVRLQNHLSTRTSDYYCCLFLAPMPCTLCTARYAGLRSPHIFPWRWLCKIMGLWLRKVHMFTTTMI